MQPNHTSHPKKGKQGKSRTRSYRSWEGMIRRCTQPGDTSFFRYGGRGITVCDQWLNSFETFLTDMGEPPTPKHSIERIDNNLGYSPNNCRWASPTEQSRNKRNNHYVTHNGERLLLVEWAERLGMSYKLLYGRIVRKKWPVDRAFTTPADWRISTDEKRQNRMRSKKSTTELEAPESIPADNGFSDPYNIPDDFWENGVWVEPEPKSAVSIRLHSFVLDYFKREGRGYQSRINAVLESYVLTMMLREAEEKGRAEREAVK